MATNASLTATTRTETGKGVARKLRASGHFPAVVYGSAREPLSLTINTREADRLLERISAANTVVELSLDGGTARTLIREIQRHPVRRHIMHIDFQELVAGEQVTVKVPLVLVGQAEGVRNSAGVLDQTLYSLEIMVDPANMPNHIDVDVTSVAVGTSLHVSDIVLPPGVTVLDDPDASVLTVQFAPEELLPEPAAAEEEGTAEPEVIRAKKEEDEE